MADNDTIETFTKQLEAFQNGFAAISQNLQNQLDDVLKNVSKLEENTSFMPKIMKSNKEIKSAGEKLALIVDTLLTRLDGICEDKGIM